MELATSINCMSGRLSGFSSLQVLTIFVYYLHMKVITILVWPTSWTPAVGGLIVSE